MEIINKMKLCKIWTLVTIFLVAMCAIAFVIHTGERFFLILNGLNIVLFAVCFLGAEKFEQFYLRLSAKVQEDLYGKTIEVQYGQGEVGVGLFLLVSVAVFGLYILFVSTTNVEIYYSMIREDGPIEYASAIFWIIAAMSLIVSLFSQRKFNLLTLLIVMFFVVCAGEEISWGQRIFHIGTPEMVKAVNIQNEINLHNIGSISIFSNAFFLITVIFFAVLPLLVRRSLSVKRFLLYYSFPIANRFAIFVYIISLIVWLYVGIRFGTLGFHPYSFYAENYYTQMDDELFEMLAAYSFFCFSIMELFKKMTVKAKITD